MLKEIKLSALHAADALGASELVLNSSWRSQRLLILGYHGVSLEDEHEWEPSLFMPASFLRRRFELLEKEKCQVLPFDTAVRALYVGELPPRSVAITFDDGTHDFYCRALPILTEFGYPATLYLTTYYSYFNRPVFDPAVRYILWKARGRMLKFPEALPGPILLHGAGREAAYRAIAAYALKDDLGGSDKDALLERLACAAEVDYGAICAKRVLHIMSPEEAAAAAAAGIDIQLHTHRHRVYDNRKRFEKEIEDNRRHIERITRVRAEHFCYPGGFKLPEFPDWLNHAGIKTATTCKPGIAAPTDSPFLLPRLMDTTLLSSTEFASWISGLAAFLPHRAHVMSEGQLIQVEAPRKTPEILRGAAAARLVASPEFQAEWRRLYQNCPWGTVFQDIPFVTTWYRCYADRYEPLLVTQRGRGGKLTGVLFLAVSTASGELAQCGTHHAEYQVWLAEPGDSRDFIASALSLLRKQFPNGRIEFVFLPPNSPLEWRDDWRGQSLLLRLPRGLRCTGPGSDIDDSLAKKANRSKMNRLCKLGELRFERITDPIEFDAVLDGMIPFYNVRQAALGGEAPFDADPSKSAFYRSLMRYENLLHTTVLRLNGSIIAAHVGPINRNQVVLGMIAHSPFLARHSPGKLHLLLLCSQLAGAGFDALDLTPGGEYKHRFASHYDDAYILKVFFSDAAARKYRIERAAIDVATRLIPAESMKSMLGAFRHKLRYIRPAALPAKFVRRIGQHVFERREYRVYMMPAEKAAEMAEDQEPCSAMHRDCLKDLLLYEPSEAWQPARHEFIEAALESLGNGCHFYSRVEDGRLAHWGWLIDRQEKSHITEVGHTIDLPEGSACLFGFYTRPEYRGRGFYRESLRRILADAARTPGVKHIVIGALADNVASRRVIEQTGFRYWRSCFRRRTLGRVRRWAGSDGSETENPA